MLPRKNRKKRKYANASITSIESSPIKGSTLGRGSFSLEEVERRTINPNKKINNPNSNTKNKCYTSIRVVQHDRFRINRFTLPPKASGQSSIVQKKELTNSSLGGFERFFKGEYDHFGDKTHWGK
jgi:hypothetical protein